MAGLLGGLFASGVSAEVPTSTPLAPMLARIGAAPKQDAVLREIEAGSRALQLGMLDDSSRLFDSALASISAVYADNPQAVRARGLWAEEGSKDYKGEPYERAMAYYYRGVLDLHRGDYENARASFRSGLLQDAFAEDSQNRADFALLMFLDGWCSQMLKASNLADESFAEYHQLRPKARLPAADDRLLVIVETGNAPRKIQDGVGGNLLVYRPGRNFQEVGAVVEVNGRTSRMMPAESIYWQASTRGGRPIDRINQGKVEFKQNIESATGVVSGIAETAALLRPAYGGGTATAVIGGVSGAAALVSLVGSGIKARSDARYWANLPDMVHVLSLPMPANGDARVRIRYFDRSNHELPELAQERDIVVDGQGNGLVWAHARNTDLATGTDH